VAGTFRNYLRPTLAGLTVAGALAASVAASRVLGALFSNERGVFEIGIDAVLVAFSYGAALVGLAIGLAAAFTASSWKYGVVGASVAAVVGFLGALLVVTFVGALVDDRSFVGPWRDFDEVLPFVIPATLSAAVTGFVARFRRPAREPAEAAPAGAAAPARSLPPPPADWH